MKSLIWGMALFCLLCTKTIAQQPKPELGGQVKTIHSKILGEQRTLWIYTPTFDTNYFAKPSYPVLYLLDGDGYFSSVRGMTQYLSEINGNTALPKMIIVGILNAAGKRDRDLIPPANGTGAFYDFIEKELVPYIDSNFCTAQNRTIAGHSLGGLFVLHAMMQPRELFQQYLAGDPSIWWNNEAFLKSIHADTLQKEVHDRTLFISMANSIPAGITTTSSLSDLSKPLEAIRSFNQLLKLSADRSFKWKEKYYADDDHGSLAMISFYDGLRYFFEANRFPTRMLFDTGYVVADVRQYIIQHYQNLSKVLKYAAKPDESFYNNLGYMFLQQKKFDRAKMFLQFNIDFYPNNFNPYDSMADYYFAVGNKTSAISFLKKAISMKRTEEMEKKLREWTK